MYVQYVSNPYCYHSVFMGKFVIEISEVLSPTQPLETI